MDKVPANIVLFDGKCKLCNWTVLWISKRDRHGGFSLLPMQSRKGRDVLKNIGLSEDETDTLVYIQGEAFFIKSRAVLMIFRQLGWPYKLLYSFIIIPGPIRDFLYNIIARTRYRFFGRQHSCKFETDGATGQDLPQSRFYRPYNTN